MGRTRLGLGKQEHKAWVVVTNALSGAIWSSFLHSQTPAVLGVSLCRKSPSLALRFEDILL